jgi:glycerol-3-phosphate acyltransferase PlsY
MLKVVAVLAFAYLVGSIPCGWLVMKVWRNQDVRRLGSGNIGAANVYRAGGLGTFVITMVADGLKGSLAVLAGILIGFGSNETVLALTGLVAVVGHNWPIYLRFKGGKGVATSGGVMLVLAPLATVVSVAAWILSVRFTRVASLSSLIAVALGFVVLLVLRITGWVIGRPVGWSVILLGVILLSLVLFRHRANIERLIRGREPELRVTPSH